MNGTDITRIGSVLAAIAVAAGAFGAHALRTVLTPERLDVWKTATHYHLAHAIALVAIGLFMQARPQPQLATPALLMAVGIVVFSGSLYLLCLTHRGWLGAITPIGGLAFIASWLLLAWRVRAA